MTTHLTQPPPPLEAPGPPGWPLIGNVLRFGGDKNMLFHFIDLWNEYGDMAHVKLGSLHIYVVANPENVHHVLVRNAANYIKGSGYAGFRLLVGQGLVTSDGELWRRQRRLMQPAFTPRSIVEFFDMMVDTTARKLDRWQDAARAGRPLHMDDEMAHLTMSVISKAIFGVDLGEESREVSEAFHAAFAFVTERTMSAVALPLRIPLPKHRRFTQNLQVIDAFVEKQITAGHRSGAQDTLLSLLLKARDEETGQPMSRQQVRDEVVTLFLAGFETTARSLTWGWYLLARHPHIMAKVVEEVDRVLDGRPPTVEDLYKLTYTRMVVDEVLRLYPPTALLGRETVQDDVIGGYHIPARAIVMLIPFMTHRHPEAWPNPERFDPERFRSDSVYLRPKSAYIPFISGPRVCLGNNFALMEMALAFAMTATRYHLAQTSVDEIGFAFRGSTCPTAPLMLRFGERET
jgi:cytochrome P450